MTRTVTPIQSASDKDFSFSPQKDWRLKAACRGKGNTEEGMKTYYPETGITAYHGKKDCAVCQVKADCLQEAIDHKEDYGLWGGIVMNKKKRNRLLKNQPQ
jgi:WhiB family transcriptional regulator, redox-sensing transcriptional regulator